MAKKKKITVDEVDISMFTKDDRDYISLTDIDKKFDGNGRHIENWMRNQNTIEYLATWESLYNPDFNSMQLHGIKEKVGLNRFLLSVSKWVKMTKAIGLLAKAGRYGGTFAHPDIAFHFCLWLSPSFQLFITKEYQRLKADEARRLNIEWNLRRELSKAHYPMLKEAVINALPTQESKAGFYLADEADLINQIVFGMTAKQWRAKNPKTGKQNMRDFATVEQLLLVSDLEVVDSLLIKWECDKELRTDILEKFAGDLRRHFQESSAMERIKAIQDRSLK